MTRLLAGRKGDPRTERVLFALVANRALAPGSKLAAAGWVTRRAHIDGLAETSDDACHRAMDWLLDIAPDLEREVFWQVATLLDKAPPARFGSAPSSPPPSATSSPSWASTPPRRSSNSPPPATS